MRLKGQYVAAQGLGGAMFWELSNDDGPLLDALRAGLGRAGPAMDHRYSTRSPRQYPWGSLPWSRMTALNRWTWR